MLLRQASELTLANLIALESHGPHALVERIGKYEWHCERQHSGSRRDGRKHRRDRLDIERVDQDIEHFAWGLKIEIDHFFHYQPAHLHPDCRTTWHEVAH